MALPKRVLLLLAGIAVLACVSLQACGGRLRPEGSGLQQVHRAGNVRTVGPAPVRFWWKRALLEGVDQPFVPMEGASAVFHPSKPLLFIGSSRGNMLALGIRGTVAWVFESGSAIHGPGVLSDDGEFLYFGSMEGLLFAVRTESGELAWKARLEGSIVNAPLLHGEQLFVVTEQDNVVAMRASDGAEIWSVKRTLPDGLSIAGHAGLTRVGDALVAAFTDGVVQSFAMDDGKELWMRDTSLTAEVLSDGGRQFFDVDTTPLMVGDRLLVASINEGLFALNPENGSVIERWSKLDDITAIEAVDDKRVLTSAAKHGLVMRDANTMKPIWTRPIKHGGGTTPRYHNGWVFVGESHGGFLVLDEATGEERSRLETGHGFGAPPALQGRVGVVLSNGGSLLSFRVLN